MSLERTEDRKDDALLKVEVNMSTAVNGKVMLASSGSETMACLTL